MNVKFKIESIFENNFYLKRVPSYLHEFMDEAKVKYEIELDLKVNEKENILKAQLGVKMIYDDIDFLKTKIWSNSDTISDENLQTFMKLGLTLTFKIDPLASLIKKEKQQKELDTGLLALVSEITLSTARGIIYTKSQGSIVGENFIPYISSTSFSSIVKDLK